MTNKHKWRVNVYLGKERYQQLESMSKVLKAPISQLVRVMIETGFQLADVAGVTNDAKQ